MADKKKLTAKQKDFAAQIAAGVKPTQAARVAGYAADSAQSLRVQACRNLALPQVQRAAFEEREKILHGPLAAQALATLAAVMGDDAAPAAARVQAARWSLEAAGHGLAATLGSARLGLNTSEKPVSQLSIGDLEAMAAQALGVVEGLRDAKGREIVEIGAFSPDLAPTDGPDGLETA